MAARRSDQLDEAELFRRFQRTPTRELRNEIVERYMGFAHHVVNRYGRFDDPDLRQAAMFGLVKAADRFDPSLGHAFTTFAGATIEGEIKRHFRDHTWKVRVPRRAKELHLLVRDAGDELAQRNGRSPTLAEIATHLGITLEDVTRGLSATAAASVASLDGLTADDDDEEAASDRHLALADDDLEFDHRLDQTVLADLLAQLPERQRRIVALRFYEGLSQSEIAERIGISQMHVSRLLRRSFAQMRATLESDDPPSGG
ncbi:MAG: sigma-70 family RNA polymerase sigma factor [Actinomycetota bacterium]